MYDADIATALGALMESNRGVYQSVQREMRRAAESRARMTEAQMEAYRAYTAHYAKGVKRLERDMKALENAQIAAHWLRRTLDMGRLALDMLTATAFTFQEEQGRIRE